MSHMKPKVNKPLFILWWYFTEFFFKEISPQSCSYTPYRTSIPLCAPLEEERNAGDRLKEEMQPEIQKMWMKKVWIEWNNLSEKSLQVCTDVQQMEAKNQTIQTMYNT